MEANCCQRVNKLMDFYSTACFEHKMLHYSQFSCPKYTCDIFDTLDLFYIYYILDLNTFDFQRVSKLRYGDSVLLTRCQKSYRLVYSLNPPKILLYSPFKSTVGF